MSETLALNPLTAVSAIDGRYATRTAPLRAQCSEFALIRYRVRVEVAWFRALAAEPGIAELPALSAADDAFLVTLARDFSLQQAEAVKAIEARTNHDVKAVEYWLKAQLRERPALAPYLEFVHFACTSEDINNLAYALMLAEVRDQTLLPVAERLIDTLTQFATDHRDVAMLARTHGQPASPTTLDKELMNVVARLRRARQGLARAEIMGKLNGAVGNYNAHVSAYPDIDWPALSARCIEALGLRPNPMTTQIEPHDWTAEWCDALARMNRIVLDLDRDVWSYIAIDYFGQRAVAGETGSSTMPHKVNPIDFENSEGNLGVANALLHHLADKLPVSRWQRDLSDSTVLRTLGTAAGHTLLAWESTLKGLGRLTVNLERVAADLELNWEVLAEPVQTVMRRAGMPEPYERLKAMTRGERLTRERYLEMLTELDLPAHLHDQLASLAPATYTGLATRLADAARAAP